MFGPVPSNLVLLNDLGKCASGTKVRFLGCVDEYIVTTATLRLKHDNPPSSGSVTAHVNIEHVLEQMKHHLVDVGAWINIIGYVERKKEKGIFVQAIAVWSAGNVDLNAYGDAIGRRQESE